MKRAIRIIVLAMLLTAGLMPASSFAQDQGQQPTPQPPEMVMVPKDRLTPEQLGQLKSEQTMQQLEQYGKWASMGKAIGIGVRETLSAVTDETSKFANTDVGKVTMFLVAWKIMADDLVNILPEMVNSFIGYVVGIPLFLICTLCVFWSYRKHGMPRRVLVKTTRTGIFTVTKEWKEVEPESTDMEGVWIAHGIAFVVVTIISLWIIFS